jgi:hypothetical protein
MHPDVDYFDPRDGDDADGRDSGTWDPYVASLVTGSESPTRKSGLSESMRVVVDELNTTATSRRAELLNSRGRY